MLSNKFLIFLLRVHTSQADNKDPQAENAYLMLFGHQLLSISKCIQKISLFSTIFDCIMPDNSKPRLFLFFVQPAYLRYPALLKISLS